MDNRWPTATALIALIALPVLMMVAAACVKSNATEPVGQGPPAVDAGTADVSVEPWLLSSPSVSSSGEDADAPRLPCVSVGSSPDLQKARDAAMRNDPQTVRKLLEYRVRSGGGTIDEARLVKVACKVMGDKVCVLDIKSQYPDNRVRCPNAPP